MIEATTSSVVAVPPTSRVSTPGAGGGVDGLLQAGGLVTQPEVVEHQGTARIVPMGLATPCPAMSGAEP